MSQLVRCLFGSVAPNGVWEGQARACCLVYKGQGAVSIHWEALRSVFMHTASRHDSSVALLAIRAGLGGPVFALAWD